MKKLFLILSLATNMYAQDAQEVKILVQAICDSNVIQVNKALERINFTQDELTELINFAKQRTCYIKGVLEGMGSQMQDLGNIFLLVSMVSGYKCFESTSIALELARKGKNTFDLVMNSAISSLCFTVGVLGLLGFIEARRAIKKLPQDQCLKNALAIERALITYLPHTAS